MSTEQHIPRALLSFGHHSIVLPVEDAVAAFALLCKGDAVEYDWSTKAHKRLNADSGYLPSLKMFSITDYAALTLNTD